MIFLMIKLRIGLDNKLLRSYSTRAFESIFTNHIVGANFTLETLDRHVILVFGEAAPQHCYRCHVRLIHQCSI